MTFTVRRSTFAVFVVLVMIAAGVFAASRATAASSTPVVYVAVGDNFPDALGAASAAAVQGGPVLLVQKDAIPPETKAELTRLSPDVIYVSGGTGVITDAVFNALKAYAPTVTRVAGSNRYGTAAAVSQSAFPATGGVGGGDVTALTATVNTLVGQVNGLIDRVDDLEAANAALEARLAGVSRDGNTLLFTGMNVQVVNGTGVTSSSNSVGNVIIGYNNDNSPFEERTGSHYLVLGDENSYTKYAGIIAGELNTASGNYASVLGGYGNTASAVQSTVLGGSHNTASSTYSTVSGGYTNTASANWASVSGGHGNTASGAYASVTGGYINTASSLYASVCGGDKNTASANWASVSGGRGNTASGAWASVSGGHSNTADGDYSSVTGGDGNEVVGNYDTVVGGDNLTNISWTGAIAIGEGTWYPSD